MWLIGQVASRVIKPFRGQMASIMIEQLPPQKPKFTTLIIQEVFEECWVGGEWHDKIHIMEVTLKALGIIGDED